jgi:RNA-directed DNA polymerase
MEKRGRQDGITTEQAKGRTQRWQPLLPNLQRVNEAARSSGQTRFTALLHHVDVAALERAFRRLRRAASPGMDRVTVDDYERELEGNLRRLHDSIHSGQYWPKPVRRTYIPKADGGRRPLGIPALEDKIVQGAVAEVLNAVYEADFMGFSYGFRPERSPHAALAALDKALMTQRVDWVLDVDIRTFFDSVDHGWLMWMLTHRIADRRVLRLIERWLKAGLLESGRWEPVEVGTPQGSGISPILANVFLHYAVDLWVHRWRRRSAAGQVIICRYADDLSRVAQPAPRMLPVLHRQRRGARGTPSVGLPAAICLVIGCQHEAEARQLLVALKDRLAQFGLSLHEGKTRLIEFGRFATERRAAAGQRRPETFDFLGFTHYCGRTRSGRFVVKRKTQAKRMVRKLKAVRQDMLHRMHAPVREQHRWLGQILRGHYRYYGVIFNYRALRVFKDCVVRLWRKVLSKRSQKGRVSWASYKSILAAFPLPEPALHQAWHG